MYTATGGIFKVNVTLKAAHEDDEHCSFPLGKPFSRSFINFIGSRPTCYALPDSSAC